MSASLADCCWPLNRLTECLAALQKSVAGRGEVSTSPPERAEQLSRWFEHAAESLNCEVFALSTTYAELETQLRSAFPAILALGSNSYLALAGRRGEFLTVITPSLEKKKVRIAEICRAIRRPHAQTYGAAIDHLLVKAGVRSPHRNAVADVLLNDQLASKRFECCWILRPSPGRGFLTWLKETGALRNGLVLIGAHAGQYLLWLTSWALVGTLSFNGHMDRGWLIAWALLLATLAPFQAVATWMQGVLAVGVGGAFKRRLLCGALQLNPEEVRSQGIGHFLSQALESEVVESLALGGGIAGLLACIDLTAAACVLGHLAVLLIVWFAIATLAAYRFLQSFARWSGCRLEMTDKLVESMIGHRTRLVQEHPERWHQAEDRSLDTYLTHSRQIDRVGAVLVAAIPRGWLLTSLAFLVPGIVTGPSSLDQNTAPQIAITLGGVLLAFSAFERLAASFSEIAVSWIAWKRVHPLFDAARRTSAAGHEAAPASVTGGASSKVIEAEKLEFRYRPNAAPILQDCTLTVRDGDRVLLEGLSGSGKTTLASLLSAGRTPSAGLLLSGGLDVHSLGAAGWRERIVAVPQFHENHVLTGTLAFNLLLGHDGTPTPADLDEAGRICRGLGLGSLLDRMPGGLLQVIGEGGWQLSHGERSRIFIARALLQNAPLTILDESFGALDPESLQVALEYTRERARTLMVIAHP